MSPAGPRPVTVPTALRRRWDGTYDVDPWGLDADLASLALRVAGLRWSIEVTGAELVPRHGAAVLVFTRRWGISEPAVLAAGVERVTGRRVRVAGVPDVAPVAPVLHRLGGVSGHRADLAGLLGAGEVVAVGLTRRRLLPGPGRLRPDALAPAVVAGVALVPVAVRGREPGRRWRVSIGPPVRAGRGDDLAAVVGRVGAACALLW